ncbi:XrtA/PEP-CTERM system histidine kinase PrsK [Pseudoduganella umbonata]|uniref:histidine kinase n=1 Tax=Pseudoduganella umbonata TaxID=864828 RepID=A0A4P8HNR0_9BURK|nr:XrtA/PEP-CTERM system histidine kinase PrsK [Pseudoduganella umbonata]MBB3220084.1 putative PEP-CTERM system histidine kinase [Pseudoduganella umbonata]QCP10084.1 PEP-CTERM system histidine kinase PrsK [Pseudoduganella umbonata]
MEGAALVASASHGIGAVAFAAFSLLLLLGRRVQGQHRLLLTACALTATWSAATALHDYFVLGVAVAQVARVLETFRTAAWLVFLMLLLQPSGLPAKRLLAVVALLSMTQLATGELAPVTIVLGYNASQPADPALIATIASSLLLAVVGILLVEQLYRCTPTRERWGIKFACLAFGTLFAYDFYLYSDALLFRRVEPHLWAGRGVVDALCVPLLAITAARNPGWKLELFISRKMMLRSAGLLACAVYLMAMAAGGWYLRSVGGAWGPVMQLICLCGAGLILAGVLFSGAARARLRVFISKHFYQGHFDYRNEWCRFTQVLSEVGPSPGERAIQAVAALVESPAGALWIRRNGAFEPAASWNVPAQLATETTGSAFCRLLEGRQWIVVAGHLLRHAEAPYPAWLHGIPGLWLVVPLMLHGQLFGFIALTGPRTPVALNWEVFDVLRLAGSQAASCLAHGELAERLSVARQFESFNRMTTFVVHDLKNLLSQHSLLLANAQRHKDNPAFQKDMLATLEHSVQKMTAMLHRLSRGDHAAERSPHALADVLRRAISGYATAQPCPTLDITDLTLFALVDGQRLERTVAHLLQNAMEATPPDGHITVSLRRLDESAVIEVRDTGAGMSEAFMRERLFRPFETTKPAGMGIGVYESREYIRELGGRFDVDSRPGFGSTFRIVLPLELAAEKVPAMA